MAETKEHEGFKGEGEELKKKARRKDIVNKFKGPNGGTSC